MSKHPKHMNERLFKDYEKYGRKFQTNWELLREQHPDKF